MEKFTMFESLETYKRAVAPETSRDCEVFFGEIIDSWNEKNKPEPDSETGAIESELIRAIVFISREIDASKICFLIEALEALGLKIQ